MKLAPAHGDDRASAPRFFMHLSGDVKLWVAVIFVYVKGTGQVFTFLLGEEVFELVGILCNSGFCLVHDSVGLSPGELLVGLGIQEMVVEYAVDIGRTFGDRRAKVFVRLHHNQLMGCGQGAKDGLLASDQVGAGTFAMK